MRSDSVLGGRRLTHKQSLIHIQKLLKQGRKIEGGGPGSHGLFSLLSKQASESGVGDGDFSLTNNFSSTDIKTTSGKKKNSRGFFGSGINQQKFSASSADSSSGHLKKSYSQINYEDNEEDENGEEGDGLEYKPATEGRPGHGLKQSQIGADNDDEDDSINMKFGHLPPRSATAIGNGLNSRGVSFLGLNKEGGQSSAFQEYLIIQLT